MINLHGMLISSLCTGLLGRKMGVNGAKFISVACLITAALLSIFCFVEVSFGNSPVNMYLFNWIDSEILVVD